MDLSFATQALASEWAVKNRKKLSAEVYDVSAVVENRVARIKLDSMGIQTDRLTKEQKKYFTSWNVGT